MIQDKGVDEDDDDDVRERAGHPSLCADRTENHKPVSRQETAI